MPKIINVTGVVQERLYITPPQSGSLLVQRDYRVVGDDDLLDRIGLQVLSVNIAWSAVPLNIRNALIEIDSWTGSQINIQEGL